MEIDQLRELFEGIRDENRRYANTATRIGNAFLALLSYIGTPGQDKYIRKDIEDFASGHISFNDGLSIPTGKAAKIGAGSITWDSANNCFHFSHGIYSDDFISALGISNGMSSGGSFDLLQEWDKYVDETAKSTALSAYLGKDLLDRIKALDLSGYATKDELNTALSEKADKSLIINAGTGLSGGGALSGNVTLSLATVGTAGTYTKVTVDKYGRVTGHATLSASDIPTLEISKINGLQTELDKKLNKTDFGASFATEMAKWFAKDSDGNVYVVNEKGFYSNSFISALGLNNSEGGTGGTSYDRLDNWADYSSDKATWVLSALLGHELNSRVSALEAGGATSVVTTGSGNVVTAVTKSGTVITATKGITALTSHQAIYALTLQGNGTTIGTFNPKSANATINITPANIGAATSGHKHTISIVKRGSVRIRDKMACFQ